MDSENYQLELPYRPSSVSVYWKKITIPKGLPALLETFVRETIRENPDDICKFLADLTQSMLAKRAEEQEAESGNANTTEAGDAGGAPVASNGNATKQKSVDEESPLLVDSPPASIQSTTIEIEDQKQKREEAEKPLEAVVAVSDKPAEDKVIAFEGLPEEIDAATKQLQAADFRGSEQSSAEREAEAAQTNVKTEDDAQPAEDANNANVKTAATTADDDGSDSQLVGNPEEIEAATKIQAGYRGFQTRKQLKEGTEEVDEKRTTGVKFAEPTTAASPTSEELLQAEVESAAESVVAGVEEALSEEILAATKIQAGFRGFQTRKALQRDSSRPEDDESENVPVEEEILSATAVSPAAASPSPKDPEVSPIPSTEEKDDDEEIAAEIKGPLETIREESFDASSSSQALPPKKAQGDEPNATTAEEANSTEVVGHSETVPATVPEAEEPEEQSTSSPDEDISKAEDILSVAGAIPTFSSAPNSASNAERLYNVHMISTEDVSAALGDLLDDTEDDEEANISEEIFNPVGTVPTLAAILQEQAETEQDQAGITKGPTNNNDTDNKNDELKSSSDNGPAAAAEANANDNNYKTDDDGINDNKILDSVQNGDHQTETTTASPIPPITEQATEAASTTTTSSVDVGDSVGIPIPPHENTEDAEVSPIARPPSSQEDNDDRVEVVIEEKTQNIPPEDEAEKQANDDDEQKQEERQEAEKTPVAVEEAINLSSSEEIVENAGNSGNACETTTTDTDNGTDQTAICADGKEDVDDKNTKTDHDVKGGDDDHDDDGIIIGQSTEKEGETNAEKNTPNANTEEDGGDHTAPQEDQELGHHNQDEQPEENAVVVDDDNCGGDAEAEEKSGAESIQLQQSNASALTESSVDREDTDIATPTDFSLNNNGSNNPNNQEEADKDSLNLEELKKFASNFEEEAEITMEPTTINNAEGAGPSAEQKPAEASPPPAATESSSSESASAESGQVIQVEVKPETPSAEPPTPILKPESEPASESTASEVPAEQNQSAPATTDAEQAKSPEPAAQTPEAPAQSPETPATESAPAPAAEPAQSPEAPAAETTSEPAPESAPAVATEPATEPVVESAPAPAQESAPEPAAESAAAPAPESSPATPATESVSVTPTESAPAASGKSTPAPAETSPTPAAETSPTPAAETSPTPAAETSPTPAAETSPTPAAESSPTPAAESSPTPAAESSPTPAAESSPTPAAESSPTPAAEASPTPAAETPPTPAAETSTTPAAESSPTPVAESSPTPAAESSPAPTSESSPTPAGESTAAPAAEPAPASEPAPSSEAPKSVEESQPTSPAPEGAAQPQSPTPAPTEPGSEQPKTDASAEKQAPPASEAAPAPEQTVTPAPPTDSLTVPPNPESTPASTTETTPATTTNPPEQSESSAVSSAPSGPADQAAANNKDAIKKQSREEVDIAETSAIQQDKEAVSDQIKPEKPAVRPRLKQSASQQSQSFSVEEEKAPAPTSEREEGATSSPSQSPSVLRRPRSGPGRSRAATSKYRSGLVIDSQMSMDEMEKEIESEMMNNAATKIQARFRGFQTRKQIGSQYGSFDAVSKTDKKSEEEGGDEKAPAATSEQGQEDDVITSQVEACSSPVSAAEASVEGAVGGVIDDNGQLDAAASAIASRAGKPPPLSTIRSLSFPGSHDDQFLLPSDAEDHSKIPASVSAQDFLGFVDEGEEDRLLQPEPEEPDIELELDPDYINKAATRIQANFRGYQVRKSFKRPSSGKENSGSKNSPKSQKLADAVRQEIEDYERARALEQRLQENNNNNEDPPAQPDKAAAKIQASFRGYKERHRFHQQKKAAITIQANIRGYLTRKRLANLRRRSFQRRRSSAKAFQKELEDVKKVHEAATKIQAVFRGYQVRSKMPRSSSMINEQDE